MKTGHLIIGFAALAFLVPYSTAVVGGPEAGEGEAVIMGGGSSSSASASVGPNGTEWRSEVSMTGRSANATEDRLEDIQYGEENYTVEFTGVIIAPTPCHILGHEVSETDSGYVMNIETQRGNSDRSCAQVITPISYDAQFSTDQKFTLEVRHDNETVRTLEHPGLENKDSRKGFFSGLVNWFSGLF